MSTTLTGKNQVTIPAAIAREMNLEPGSRLEWLKGDVPGVIIIKVLPSRRQLLARAQEIGAELKKEFPDWDPIADLIAERELDMAEEE